MKKQPKPGPGQQHMPSLSAQPGGADTGRYVLVGVLPMQYSLPKAVPLMEPTTRMTMRRFPSVEEALAVSASDAILRRHGGWILNLRTGETVRVEPMR